MKKVILLLALVSYVSTVGCASTRTNKFESSKLSSPVDVNKGVELQKAAEKQANEIAAKLKLTPVGIACGIPSEIYKDKAFNYAQCTMTVKEKKNLVNLKCSFNEGSTADCVLDHETTQSSTDSTSSSTSTEDSNPSKFGTAGMTTDGQVGIRVAPGTVMSPSGQLKPGF
jgi:hypothetical protein